MLKNLIKKNIAKTFFMEHHLLKKNLQHKHNNYQKRNIKTAQDPLGSEGKVSRCRICD